MPTITAQSLIKALDLSPHPEGGYYRRTYQNTSGADGRGHATAIYYLLEGTDFALWHKVDADELWFWHAGAPLTLETCAEDKTVHRHILGPNLIADEKPQIMVPARTWQRAKSSGDYTLASCCVSPGFMFDHYELADKGFNPAT